MDASLLLEHLSARAPPPPALAQRAASQLVPMGFPHRVTADFLDGRRRVRHEAYVCPRCKARVSDLPTSCPVCRLTLVSSPHLARSYHHLFPVPAYEEVAGEGGGGGVCFGCERPLAQGAAGRPGGAGALQCPLCRHVFCFDCDMLVHESLHNCPGCQEGAERDTVPAAAGDRMDTS